MAAPIPIRTQISPFQAASLGAPIAPRLASPLPSLTPTAIPATFPSVYTGNTISPTSSSLPSLPKTPQQYMSLAKSAALITPAILLAMMKPSKVVKHTKELLPSDWKVWAKMGLSVASLTQLNKALNWSPPPWLSALMNVALMTTLMRNIGGIRQWGKITLFVGGSVAGLAQLNHYAGDKLKTPLQQKYNIPPWVTQLGLTLASTGFGIFAMPRMLAPLFSSEAEAASAQTAQEQNSAKTPKAKGLKKSDVVVMAPTCATGCCSSPICLNEVVNNVSIASEGIKKQWAQKKDDPR